MKCTICGRYHWSDSPRYPHCAESVYQRIDAEEAASDFEIQPDEELDEIERMEVGFQMLSLAGDY